MSDEKLAAMAKSPLSSQDFLREAQEATGKRQKMLLSLTQLQMLAEGPDLNDAQRSTLTGVIRNLQTLVPEKRKA